MLILASFALGSWLQQIHIYSTAGDDRVVIIIIIISKSIPTTTEPEKQVSPVILPLYLYGCGYKQGG